MRNIIKINKDGSQFLQGWMCCIFFLLLSGIAAAQPEAASDAIRLISSPPGQIYMNAQWAPDGKTIAFTSDKHNGIWLANADGSEVRLLTADVSAGFGYSWSPDGSHILVRSSVTENYRRLYQVKMFDVTNASYQIVVEKTRELNGLPQWSRDGSQVAFVRNAQPEFISPDGLPEVKSDQQTEILFPVHDKLIAVHPMDKNANTIAEFEGRVIFNTSISPDGSMISFQVQGLGLYVMNTDGTGLKNIGKGEKASWMPDNRFVIVSETEDDGYNVTGGELYAVDVVTGNSYPLTSHVAMTALKPAVSPDGKSVLFDNPDDGNIYLLPLE